MTAVAKCCMNCIRCCLACCHRFVKYINENAYCQVALTGENFCTAALNGFALILKHAGTFMFTRGIGGIFNFLGKILVSTLNVVAAYFALKYIDALYSDMTTPVPPLLVVFLISYFISSLFMSMYTITATCLLHCLFADVDICKQLNHDEMMGLNRPPEMNSIVETLSYK